MHGQSPPPQASTLDSESEPDPLFDLDNIVPVPFAGDLFGTAADYAEADETFGQVGDHPPMPTMPRNIHDDEATSDIEDEMNAELEDGWEAPRADAPAEDVINEAMDVDVSDAVPPASVAEDGRDLDANDRHEAESVLIANGHGITPKKIVRYTDRYPSSHAGETIGQENTMDSRYVQAVDGSSNVWAPFNSKVDWEIAQWAKLRSLGSTAFSDLLAIEGVLIFF